MENIFENIPESLPDELFQELVSGGRFRLERIVSLGHVTPEGRWYDQEHDEFVLLVDGGALLRFEDGDRSVKMKPGDYLVIKAGERHRVDWTRTDRPTIWLALHFEADGQAQASR